VTLKPTRLEYEFSDESGYGFKVVAEWHDEEGPPYCRGWSANVTMKSHGHVTPNDAVKHLRHAAEAFLRQLTEVKT